MVADNDNDNDKKGFSGLTALVSDLNGIDELKKPASKTKEKPETAQQLPRPRKKSASPEKEQKTTNTHTTIKTSNTRSDDRSTLGKWLLGIFAVVVFISIIFDANKDIKKSSYSPPSPSKNRSYPQASSSPKIDIPSVKQSSKLHYSMPSVGTNNVLSVSEIRWCIKEGIRIEAMRGVFVTNEGIDELNLMVNVYNSRCGSYRYGQGSQSRAENDVEPYHGQIIADAIEEAREISPSQLFSNDHSAGSTPKKPSVKYTKEAQQILTDLGYDPGPVDGVIGERTRNAIRKFERNIGRPETGKPTKALITALDISNSIEFFALDSDREFINHKNGIPLAAGTTYGWLYRVKDADKVSYKEELILPTKYRWHDQTDPSNTYVTEKTITPIASDAFGKEYYGSITHTWEVASDDPEGDYLIKVFIDDHLVKTFKVNFYKVQAKKPNSTRVISSTYNSSTPLNGYYSSSTLMCRSGWGQVLLFAQAQKYSVPHTATRPSNLNRPPWGTNDYIVHTL